MIGIYLIRNTLTDECYIGQSVNIEQRWRNHKQSMKNKKYALYSDMRFYGLRHFSFSVLETCQSSELDRREMFWIKKYQEDGYSLYNIIGVPEKEATYAKRSQRFFKKN